MIVELASFNPISDHGGTAAAGTVTLTKPSGAKDLLIQCTSGTARFTFGTVSPGTATGFQLPQSNPPLLIPLSFASTIKFCPESGTVNVSYQWGG